MKYEGICLLNCFIFYKRKGIIFSKITASFLKSDDTSKKILCSIPVQSLAQLKTPLHGACDNDDIMHQVDYVFVSVLSLGVSPCSSEGLLMLVSVLRNHSCRAWEWCGIGTQVAMHKASILHAFILHWSHLKLLQQTMYAGALSNISLLFSFHYTVSIQTSYEKGLTFPGLHSVICYFSSCCFFFLRGIMIKMGLGLGDVV